MEEKIIERINQKIAKGVDYYKLTGNTANRSILDKIEGMIEALEIVTGKSYYYDADGVHER